MSEFLNAAKRLLPPEPWDRRSGTSWTERAEGGDGAEGQEPFHPLRLALTAASHGPELAALLPLIGRHRAERRLAGQRA